MFTILKAEMVKNHVNAVTLGEMCGMKPSAIYSRLNGKTPITLDEADLIKKALNSDLPIEELFQKEEIKC